MIFIGNFKNNIPTEEYVDTITKYSFSDKVILNLPLVYIAKYERQLHDAGIFISAQSVDLDEDFANRGEINAKMLQDVGTDYVFLGHKIDKKMTLNDYSRLRKKIASSIQNGLNVVVAVGETMEEYETGITCQIVEKQIKEIFKGLEGIITQENFILAYEPKWAVGTGLSLSANELQNILRNIKSMVEVYAKIKCPIVFGGSCNIHNIPKYIETTQIDGFVMSKACLDVKNFVRILCGDRKKGE